MNKQQLIDMLHEHLDTMPMGKEELSRMEEKFADDPDADAGALSAWLSASIFYTMTWEKRHKEEGQTDLADDERERITAASKALDLLKPYVTPVKVSSPQGSI